MSFEKEREAMKVVKNYFINKIKVGIRAEDTCIISEMTKRLYELNQIEINYFDKWGNEEREKECKLKKIKEKRDRCKFTLSE